MDREMTVTVADQAVRIFMQEGFFSFRAQSNALHRHHCTEVQIIASGRGEYTAEGRRLTVGAGEMLVVPPGHFHASRVYAPGTRHIAFQMLYPVETVRCIALPDGIADQLCAAIERYLAVGSSHRLAPVLAVICAEIDAAQADPTEPIRDRGFLIAEFFAKNYAREATLGELAGRLGLSEKQTARLVRRHTGCGFREMLTRSRLEAARQLMAEGQLSLSEIALEVGYQSYSGFWKAFRAQM